MRPVKSSTPVETVARAANFVIALVLLYVSGYLAFFQTPVYPIAALVFAAFSLWPLWIALYGKRKLVFQVLLLVNWF